jgi:hypothetical protein
MVKTRSRSKGNACGLKDIAYVPWFWHKAASEFVLLPKHQLLLFRLNAT